MSRIDVRAEDVLTVGAAAALSIILGVKSLGTFQLTEHHYWDFAFLLLPIALLVFQASVRYAFRPIGVPAFSTVSVETGHILRDWFPFLAFLMIYEAFRLRTWALVLPVDKDAMLLRWDTRLFGVTPSVPLEAWIAPSLTTLLTYAYALHLVLPPVMGLLWYRRSLHVFREFLLAILVAGIVGSQGYAFVPAIGPGYAYPSLYHRLLSGATYENLTGLLDSARAPRDAFPSLHVAVSSIVLWFAWRRGRLTFAIVLPLVLANWLSTIYLRYHYMVDVIAGWILAVAAIALASLILRIEASARGSRARSADL